MEPSEQAATLGANCLAGLYGRRASAVDAHRAALDVIAGSGFTVTEISFPGRLSVADAPPLRRHAEAAGLQIRAVHAPPMRRDPALIRQREAAALAAELGAALLIVHVSSLRFASPNPTVRIAARERDLRRLDALIRCCAPHGIALALENGKHPTHPHYLLTLLAALEGTVHPDEASPFDRPLTSSPHHLITSSAPTGLVFDSGHAALRGSDPVESLRAMLPRLVHTHLHDNRGARDEHLPPGSGRIDWPPLLDLLRDGGYPGALLLELRPRSGSPPEHWQRDLAIGRRTLMRTPAPNLPPHRDVR